MHFLKLVWNVVWGLQYRPQIQQPPGRTHRTQKSRSTHSYGLFQKTEWIMVRTGKGRWGRVQGRPGGSFHLPFPGESCGQLSFLPALMHMWYCPSRKFTRDLVAWVFIECQVHGVHHVTDLSYSVSSPSRGQGDTVWPKAPTINHIRSLGVTQGPR